MKKDFREFRKLVSPAAAGTLALAAMLCAGAIAETGAIAWELSYDAGIAAAKEANKPVLIDFTAEWCVWCRKMDEEVYTDPAVVEALKAFVCIKLDTDRDPRVALAYQVRSLPRTLILNTFDEVTVDRTGYMPATDFLEAVADGRANAHLALGANPAPAIKPIETPAQTVERMLSESEGDRDAVLLALLSDPDPGVRRQALELVKAGKDASIPLLVKGLTDSYLGTRIASLEALRALGVKSSPFDPWALRSERERAAAEWTRALAVSSDRPAE